MTTDALPLLPMLACCAHKHVLVFAMSGLGKTPYWRICCGKSGDWFHIPSITRIGTRYFGRNHRQITPRPKAR